jgi:ATP-dependent Lhr-like helicase
VLTAAFPDAQAAPTVALPESLQRSVDAGQAILALVRGRLQLVGPATAHQIAEDLGIEADAVRDALDRLESEGIVLRGQFTGSAGETEWCERRLLARIHRLTLDGLRRQVQPLEPEVFLRFLVRHQLVERDGNLAGPGELDRVIARLQGFECSAGAWERDVLPSRMNAYESQWLDGLFHRGQIIWGRLRPPAGNGDDLPGNHVLTRAVPISLMHRADLAWLLPAERGEPWRMARGDAQAVYEALIAHGALFFEDLLAATGLLRAQLENALGELAALGVVTADGFGAIRSLVTARKLAGRPGRNRRGASRSRAQAGRWSRFPPFVQPILAEQSA